MAAFGKVDGRGRTFDTLLEMKDAGLVAASAAATVSAAAKIIDVGEGEMLGELVVDISAIEVDTGDELYSIVVQGSDVSDFSTGSPDIQELCCLNVGDATQLSGNTDTTTGRYLVPFRNWKNDKVYRYLRVYTTVAGTIATGINYKAYIGVCH